MIRLRCVHGLPAQRPFFHGEEADESRSDTPGGGDEQPAEWFAEIDAVMACLRGERRERQPLMGCTAAKDDGAEAGNRQCAA